MSAPTCAECAFGRIGMHSKDDACSSALNVSGYPPYALRHDEALCGTSAAWFAKKGAPDPVYRAELGVKGETGVLPVEVSLVPKT